MTYDSDDSGQEPLPPTTHPTDPHDLETIVSLLEMAAIGLTTVSKETFTRDELLREARAYGGAEINLDEKAVDIVIGTARFLKKEAGQRLSLR